MSYELIIATRTQALELALDRAQVGTDFDEVLVLADRFYQFLIGQEDKEK